MPNIDIQALQTKENLLKLQPTVVTYSRLEPQDLTTGDLSPGLEARIADPLWMIGRQWQFEELRGEDGGSPILAEVHAERAPLSRLHPGAIGDPGAAAAAAVNITGDSIPLEVAVEAETPRVLPERIRAALGLHLVRLLRAAGLPPAVLDDVLTACRTTWPFPAHEAPPDVDPAGTARRRVYGDRIPDAASAAADLRARTDATGVVKSLPDALATAGTDAQRTTIRDIATRWLAFTDKYLAAPAGTSWNPHRLEYSFAAQATLSTGDVVLRADEYVGGTVDWHSLDASASSSLGPTQVQPTPVAEQLVPTPVKYPGMPSERLWAFEDGAVQLGELQSGTTDLARLALVEFALAFGTDWFMVPFGMEYGDVTRVHSVRVVDTFGVEINILPSRDVGRPGWTAFQHTEVTDNTDTADVFVLPATVPHALQGPPLEEVVMFRDEMANLVWGVERIVQAASGEPAPRGLAESRSLRQTIPGDLGDAKIVYRLMTPVPDHWIPFVSVPVAGRPPAHFTTELERRPIVHFATGATPTLVHPRGVLLRADASADPADDLLRVAEEEIPREGIVLTRRFQLARTPDGRTLLWVGRQKATGRGEGSSGLRYDTALPPA